MPSQQTTAVNLGPLQDLPGFWEGTGFDLIARPDFSGGNPNGFFLELNLLRETIEFTTIGSLVFNRGSVQDDITIYGVTYLHRITEDTTGGALHPATTDPQANASIARLATIPHGNAICTVGFAEDVVIDKLPTIPPANTVPFKIGSEAPLPGTKNPFPEYDLSVDTRFLTVPYPGRDHPGGHRRSQRRRRGGYGTRLSHETISRRGNGDHDSARPTPQTGGNL